MASPTRWMWVWVNSGSWWWTGRPGMLQFIGSQRVGHDWAIELNWTEWYFKYILRDAAKTCHYNLLNDAIFFSSLLYPYYLILICHCLNCLCSYRYFCLFFCSSSVHFNFESHLHNTVNVYNAINIELENVRLFLLVSSNSSWDLKNIYWR